MGTTGRISLPLCQWMASNQYWVILTLKIIYLFSLIGHCLCPCLLVTVFFSTRIIWCSHTFMKQTKPGPQLHNFMFTHTAFKMLKYLWCIHKLGCPRFTKVKLRLKRMSRSVDFMFSLCDKDFLLLSCPLLSWSLVFKTLKVNKGTSKRNCLTTADATPWLFVYCNGLCY